MLNVTILGPTPATNNYVSTSTTLLSLDVTNGVPFSKAVLLDSTNFASATWTSYDSASVTASLGSTEGRHEVWIGLRGRAEDSDETWERKWIKRDFTPPTLMITNPTTSTVSQPMIQLEGYCPEALSSISCNVSNAAGLFTNQMILVLHQCYDTNLCEFTTNAFQGFDIELTNGLNTLTLRAVDLAGNCTVGDLTLTLTNDTSAPVLDLYWPQDGASICGDSFTWRGQVDDFTAALTASTVDSEGITNTTSILVERDGRFWAENLPLHDGANLLILTATDAWANVTVTNISVMKSTLTLTIDPPEIGMTNVTTIVTGTISDTGYTVWVNGVSAANDNGTWTAENVPVPDGNTTVVQARAIPASDNGGNGSGGAAGGAASYENPGNPSSAQAQDVEAATDKIEGISIEWDSVTRGSLSRTDWEDAFDHWLQETMQSGYGHAWLEGAGGGGSSTLTEDVSGSYGLPQHCEGKTVYDWPESLTEEGTTFTTLTGTGDCEEGYTPGPGVASPIPICKQHCKVSVAEDLLWIGATEIETQHEEFYKIAQTALVLHTGGKAIPGRRNLWVIRGGASKVNHWVQDPCSRPDLNEGIPSEQVTIGALGTLGSDGLLYVVLPDGITKDATPAVAGEDYYTFDAGGTKYKSHMEVFVRQPFPNWPKDSNSWFPYDPPPGYPAFDVIGGKWAGHAWWKLTSEAPAGATSRFTDASVARWLDLETGYGPINVSLLSVYPLIQVGGPGHVYHDNGASDVHRVYAIGFMGPGVLDGLYHAEQLTNNPGIWNAATHNCVHETVKVGAACGVYLPIGPGTPETFGFSIPPNDL